MVKKKTHQPKQISNRRARHDYALEDGFVVGLALTGAETKALRLGHGQLQGAYVNVKNGELWLVNALISGAPGMVIPEAERTRDRKLLANKREIADLLAAKQQGRTIVPLTILSQGRYIKLRIAIGKGKRNYDKRASLKERDEKRQMASAVKKFTLR